MDGGVPNQPAEILKMGHFTRNRRTASQSNISIPLRIWLKIQNVTRAVWGGATPRQCFAWSVKIISKNQ